MQTEAAMPDDDRLPRSLIGHGGSGIGAINLPYLRSQQGSQASKSVQAAT